MSADTTSSTPAAGSGPPGSGHAWLWSHYDYFLDLSTCLARQTGHADQEDLIAARALDRLAEIRFDPARGASPRTVIYKVVRGVAVDVARHQTVAAREAPALAAAAPVADARGSIFARLRLRSLFVRRARRAPPGTRRKALTALRAGKICLAFALVGLPATLCMFLLLGVNGGARAEATPLASRAAVEVAHRQLANAPYAAGTLGVTLAWR